MSDAARLAQLVRLLGTDRDGERLAAVCAIERTLKATGHDWHTLAAAVERGWQAKPKPKAPELKPWQSIAQACLVHGSTRLRAGESDFLRSMVMWTAEPSERQTRWLNAIALSLGVGRAAA